MTTLEGRPAADASPPAGEPAPQRADGLQLLGSQLGSGYRVPPALVRRADGQVLQLTPLLYSVLDAIDGQSTCEAIAEAAGRAHGKALSGDDVRVLVDGKLRPLGLVCRPDGTEAAVRRSNPLLRLRPKFVVSRPGLTRRITAPFAVLFHPAIVVPAVLAFAFVVFWVLFQKGLASAAYQAFHRPGLLLAVFAISVGSAGAHEFGHAAALRRGGGTPGAMGAGLYLVWPAFYTDVTDAYRLDRRARIRTDLGGLYFNALIAVAMVGLWALVHWDALLLVVATQILQMVRQLPPMVRFDGYHLLADVTGVPDLFLRIGPVLRSMVPGRRPVEALVLKPWVRAVVTLWVVLIVPILAVTVALAALALPRLLATTVQSVRQHGDLLRAAAGHGHFLEATAMLLAIVALIVPAAGVVYLLFRLARRLGVGLWRRTAGRPAKRAAALLAAAAVVAALAFAWWPHGNNYRPIQSYERGTVQDGLPVSIGDRILAQRVHEGAQLQAQTVWPADVPLPSSDHPALAVVMVPRDGDGTTWVFPFNRPAPPGPGDNQAMAIVTRNGGVVYDVAFALVWANGPIVLNRNEAYAFASCQHCTAVAVAFQVVLVVGDARVQAPQNIGAAVNANCLDCVAAALADQLVIDVPQQLGAARLQQLQALWKQIEAFGHHLQGLSYDQIKTRIEQYEKRIDAIVRPVAPTPAGSTGTSPSPSASSLGSTAPSAAPPVPGGSAAPTTTVPAVSPTVSPTPTPSGAGAAPTTTAPSPSATTSPATSAPASPTP